MNEKRIFPVLATLSISTCTAECGALSLPVHLMTQSGRGEPAAAGSRT